MFQEAQENINIKKKNLNLTELLTILKALFRLKEKESNFLAAIC